MTKIREKTRPTDAAHPRSKPPLRLRVPHGHR
jgi:hypothetical protein